MKIPSFRYRVTLCNAMLTGFKEGASTLVWDIANRCRNMDLLLRSRNKVAIACMGLSPTKVARERSASKRMISSFLNKIGHGLCCFGELSYPPPSDPGYHVVSKYSSRRIKQAQTRWVASSNYGVPTATFQLHHQTLVTIKYQSTRQDESNQPKLDGVASFNYGVPMATFQLHHQTLVTM
ncbi:hypothetical protein EVAR_47958_1 [Eumeta japonica]|uniref:Uncharacterized protein n=1 Tax=Eumeta variegata TaxID=151549 RepID=A0A4C1XAN9_EUMVA|nr:hypothetical protein EVAR_47958_1 [Eumeta japonica]